ncbi:MAG: DUF6471 domain-containing protein [Novosphingobium sp.]
MKMPGRAGLSCLCGPGRTVNCSGEGVVDSQPNIRNKLSRGKFTAVFLIQCLEAIGTSSLRLQD